MATAAWYRDNADRLCDRLMGDWCGARANGDDVLMTAARRSTVAAATSGPVRLLAARGELGEEVLDAGNLSFAVMTHRYYGPWNQTIWLGIWASQVGRCGAGFARRTPEEPLTTGLAGC